MEVYNEEHLANVKAALRDIDEALALAERATRAGMDVRAQKEELNTTKNNLLRWKQEFFPGQ